MANNDIIIRRLALIKYLFQKGVEASKAADIVAGFSILSFHDSIEMFLILAAESKDIKNFKAFSFMEFWSKIPDLTLRNQIEALKDRRVAIKHRGQFPSRQDIEISRINTTDFLVENTRIIFNMDFNSISLADLIASDSVRSLVKAAEEKLSNQDIFGSLCDSRFAFHVLFSEYENSKSPYQYWQSIMEIGNKVGDEYKSLIGNDTKLGVRWFKEISETTNKIRDILKYTSLGVDYRKYVFFTAVTPYMSVYCKRNECGFEPHFMSQNEYEYRHRLRVDNAQLCIDFVIECALKIQDFDFDCSQIFKTAEESESWLETQKNKTNKS
jgi:hypothetical protein